jgi:ATP-dependent helicase/nuclease subunit B
MAVQFILGRSGTGKTSLCIKGIRQALADEGSEQPLVFLVPEQATYQAERAILADGQIGGYSRLYVLSFQRLGYLVFGKNTVLKGLSTAGQQLIIQRILQQEHGLLRVFGASVGAGGAGRLTECISELQQQGVEPEDIEKLAGQLGRERPEDPAGLKFADIAVVYKEYVRFVAAGYISPEVQLVRARQAVAGAEFLRRCVLWVDGFSGFTASELALLAELLKMSAEAKIALCLDPREIELSGPGADWAGPAGLFFPTQRTYAELVELVKRCRLTMHKPVLLTEVLRFGASSGLAHVERNLFSASGRKAAADGSIRIISARNPRAEVEFAARQIAELTAEGLRYRDIAVVASDMEVYRHYIEASFADYGIPFFIDRRRSIRQHPLVELICSALRVLAEGWRQSDVFGFLRTELGPLEREQTDLLENFCLAAGISEPDWRGGSEWGRCPGAPGFDPQQINSLRREVADVLSKLSNGLGELREPIAGGRLVRAIWDMLEELNVRRKLEQWVDEAVEQGLAETADEHRQVFSRCVELLDELTDIFEQDCLPVGQWLGLLESGFAQMSLAFIPPRLDAVLVGSIERSRHPELKAVFLVGASQRRFPVPVRFESILTDEDRSTAEGRGLVVGDRTEQRLAGRCYLVYIAFTRPRERLYVTYPMADEKEQAVLPSQFVAELKGLFEDLTEESYEPLPRCNRDWAKVRARAELADFLCSRLGKDPGAAGPGRQPEQGQLRLLAALERQPELADVAALVNRALAYDNAAVLDDEFIGSYFAGGLYSSATRLSRFAECSYKHFARYILRLRKREIFRLEPLDVGIFYHLVLQRVFERLIRQGGNIAGWSDEQLKALVLAEAGAVLEAGGFYAGFAGRSLHNRFIIDSAIEQLESFAAALGRMARAGSFRPIAAELAFGGEQAEMDALRLPLNGGRTVYISGKLDRLDVAGDQRPGGQAAGGQAAIVFDYKRTSQGFSWSRFYHGLDLQLAVYLLAIRGKSIKSGIHLRPAGAFYIPIEASPPSVGLSHLQNKADKFSYKADGFFDGRFHRQLDGECQKGWSKFYGFYLKQDQQDQYGHYGNSDALRPQDFEGLLCFAQEKIKQLAEQICRGVIEVRPYRLGGASACRNCEYRAVCRFEWQVNRYNHLLWKTKSQVLESAGVRDDAQS